MSSKPILYHSFFTYWKLKCWATYARLKVLPRILSCRRLRTSQIKGATRESVWIASRDKNPDISVDIYSPLNAKGRKLPVHINWHGSGFVLPYHGSDVNFCRKGVEQLDCIFLDCDYRKAPEHPFPAAVLDAVDVTRWVLSQPSRLDTSRVSLGGFSSGRNLSLSVASILGPGRICAVIPFYPPIDFTRPSRQRQPPLLSRFRSGYVFNVPDLSNFTHSYLVEKFQHSDPRISVHLAPPSSFPSNIFMACGTGDNFYSECKNMIETLQNDGHKNATLMDIDQEAHIWDKGPVHQESIRLRKKAYQAAFDTIRQSWNK